MKTAIQTITTLLILIGFSVAANAEKRVALVIGNSSYVKVERLKNPANDARRLSDTLKSIGFDKVTLELDLSQGKLRRALRQFSRDAAGADVALIYFAGHGIEVGGTNYIVPTDANLTHVDDVEFEALPLGTMLSALNRAGKLKLVILDACRNNPFKDKMASTGSNRSIGRGLARVNPTGSDTLVAYAAKEGTVAEDGEGENSPYAKALIKHIATPGIDVRLLFGRVRDDVLKTTGRRQEPFTYGSLGGSAIYLKPPQTISSGEVASLSAGSATPEKPAGETGLEGIFWNSVKDSADPAMLEEYLRRFPNGIFAGLAKLRIQTLKKRVALAVPPKAPKRSVSDVHQCDRLAANPDDEFKLTAGVEYRKIRAVDAERECRKALAQFPGTARFQYQLGIALMAQHKRLEAAKMILKAAENGRVAAYFNLAIIYENGFGFKKDMVQSARWYLKSAEAGYVPSMGRIAAFYGNGIGVKLDDAAALRWHFKAADKGDALAMANLAVRYHQARGVPRDDAKAFRLLKEAADKENGLGLHALGWFYDAGIETRKKPRKAAGLVLRALKGGFEFTKTHLLTKSGNWSVQFRRSFQQRLKSEGVYDGPIDGAFGPSTKAAIRKLAGGSGVTQQ